MRLRGCTDPVSLAEFRRLDECLARIELQEDTYWRQRAKQHWLKDADSNTRFYHSGTLILYLACKEWSCMGGSLAQASENNCNGIISCECLEISPSWSAFAGHLSGINQPDCHRGGQPYDYSDFLGNSQHYCCADYTAAANTDHGIPTHTTYEESMLLRCGVRPTDKQSSGRSYYFKLARTLYFGYDCPNDKLFFTTNGGGLCMQGSFVVAKKSRNKVYRPLHGLFGTSTIPIIYDTLVKIVLGICH
ncbi:PREDICTED: uncharacterized protein LOC109177507 [Ipomoea nil]|uniref:uncharacterized protein LOC109177507 n=1 Tax=Ipomoea nil TaxID=35883 RepID=UPI000901B7D8|nr:PREDICTED: uncharacterized protein LOC109177507 [Ipomoea nil]